MTLKVTVLFILLLNHQTKGQDPNSILFQEVMAYHADAAQKANFASEVVDKIYNAFRQWFFTITFCEFTYFENRILKFTENYDNGYPVLLLNGCPDTNRSRSRPRLDKHGTTAYLVTSSVLSIDTSEYVTDALQRTGVFKPRSAVIFVINEVVTITEYFHFEVKNHFELLLSRSITNSVLILRSDRLKIYTYNPFLEEIQDVSEVENISRYLSRIYNNLHGLALKVSVYRKVYVSDETGPVLCDSKLEKLIMRFLNATCVPTVPRDGNTVGDLLAGGVATGVTADLLDSTSDLELSSRILKNSYYGYIDTTYPLMQDRLCFLVENSDRQATFTTTISLISNLLLLAFMLIVIAFVTISIIVRKTESKICSLDDTQRAGDTTMDLIKCLLRQTLNLKFCGPVFRILIALIMTYSLIVNCVIDGVIYKALSSTKFKPAINTVNEVLYSNLTLAVHNRDFGLFNKSITPSSYALIKNRIEIVNDNRIRDIIVNEKFQYATLLRQSDANTIHSKPAYQHNGRGIFHVVQECPVPCFIVYGLRYGSPFLPQLDFVLNSLNQAGITQFWSQTEDFALQRKIAADQKRRSPLNMDSIREVFYVLLIGTFLSGISFVLEILFTAEAWTYLELYLKALVRRFQRLNFCR